MTLERPDGKSLRSDTLKSRRPDVGYTDVPLKLRPNERRTEHLLLDEWFGPLDIVGVYRLTIDFSGSVSLASGDPASTARRSVITFEIGPRNEASLRNKCAELASITRTTKDSFEARRVGKTLTYIHDPIAIPFIASLIESGKVLEIAAIEVQAIEALEAIGTHQALQALYNVRTKTAGPTTAEAVDKALIRMQSKVK
jgi:hypothetical protein